MNIDTLAGEGTEMKGRLKEGLGDALGDSELQREGASDQLSGTARQLFGSLRDFVRDQPVVAALAAVAIGALLFGGMRGDSARR